MHTIQVPKSWCQLRVLTRAASLITMMMGGAAAAQSEDYTFHWAVKTPPELIEQVGDLQALIDTGGTPFQRDTALLYASSVGFFPFAGLHLVELDPLWMDAHLEKIAFHMDRFVPDAEFSGPIIIDYERWNLLWDRIRNEESDGGPYDDDNDYADDWRDYIRAEKAHLLDGLTEEQQENVFRTTWEKAAADFYTATFNRVKELRPQAKVGFFGYPQKFYKNKEEIPPKIIGYGDLTHTASDRNDRLQWLWDMEDILAPNVYCLFRTEEEPDDFVENTTESNDEYFRTNTEEALRLANGKPVYSVIHYKYQRGDDPLSQQFLNQINITSSLRVPGREGSVGVVLWGDLETVKQKEELEAYFHNTIVPEAQAIEDEYDDPFPTFEVFNDAFNAGDKTADLNGDGKRTFFDYTSWQNKHLPK